MEKIKRTLAWLIFILLTYQGDTRGEMEFALTGVFVAGRDCGGIASDNKHLTSSAVAKSKGVWPSWFLVVGSAPCASCE